MNFEGNSVGDSSSVNTEELTTNKHVSMYNFMNNFDKLDDAASMRFQSMLGALELLTLACLN